MQGLVADHGSDVWWEKEEAELLPPSHAAEARRTTEPGPLLALSLLALSLLALSLTLSPPLTQAGSPVEEGHRHHGRVV